MEKIGIANENTTNDLISKLRIENDSSTHGIELERIVNRESNEDAIDVLTCQICLCLSKDPLVDRSSCQNIFCSSCLKDYWMKTGAKECPLKCSNPKFESLDRIGKLHLKKLLISCKYKSLGCNAKILHDDLDNHELNCDFSLARCSSYTHCKTELPKNQMEKHENECEYIAAPCSRCTQNVTRKDLSSHDCIKYLFSIIMSQQQEIIELKRRLNEQNLNKSQEERKSLLVVENDSKNLSKSSVSSFYIQSLSCVKKLEGHIVSALQIVQLPDGRIVSSSKGELKVWDIPSQKLLCTILAHPNHFIHGLTSLKDGRVASGSDDFSIKVWNIQKQTCEMGMKEHTGVIYDLIELSNGIVASASADKTIKLWSVYSSNSLMTLEGHKAGVFSLTQLKDGRLASGGCEKTIRIWNLNNGVCEKILFGHEKPAWRLVTLSDGRIASASLDFTIAIWKIESSEIEFILKGHSNHVRAITQLSDQYLISASDDHSIKLWDLQKKECTRTIADHKAPVWGLLVLRDGGFASSSHDKSIMIWQ